MLALLLNVPHTAEQWAQFSFAHRDSHDRIRKAIKTKFRQDLVDFQIDPMTPDALSNFLQDNAQLHGDMNSLLGLQSGNIQDVDLSKDNEKATWINLHYLEHYYAEAKLFT